MGIEPYTHTEGRVMTADEVMGPAPLSTDILTKKFGPVCMEILSHDTLHRTSCIRTVCDNLVIACSEVEFHQQGIENIPDVHTKIVNGEMLGKTIRESGVTHERTEHKFQQTPAPLEFTKIFGTTSEICLSRKVEYIVAGTLYATIVEYYSPEHVDVGDFTTTE